MEKKGNRNREQRSIETLENWAAGGAIITAGIWLTAAAADQGHTLAGTLILAGTLAASIILYGLDRLRMQEENRRQIHRDQVFRFWISTQKEVNT